MITVIYVVLYSVKRNIVANEVHLWDCCRNMGHFLCGDRKGKALCERPFAFALYRQQPENEKQNVDFAHPAKIFAEAHACVYSLTSAFYGAVNNHFVLFEYPFG